MMTVVKMPFFPDEAEFQRILTILCVPKSEKPAVAVIETEGLLKQ